MNQMLLAPRLLDVGFAPVIDGVMLRRRMAASLRPAPAAAPIETEAEAGAGSQWSNAIAALRARAPRISAPWLAKGWDIVTHAAKGRSRWRFAAATALTPMAVLVAVPPALAIARLSHVEAHYGAIIADRAGIAVHMDAQAVGAVRRPGSNDEMLVLPSGISASDPLYLMYDKVEGAGERLTYFGWPVRAMVRAGVCHLGLPIEGTCGGASGGLQHAVRGLRGGFGGDGQIDRKVDEFADAPALSLLYRDDDARAALILDNVSFGYLPGGKPIIGITNAARVYFGETEPHKLSRAQKAFLIGAFKYPIPWDTGAGLSRDAVDARNAALGRAGDALVKTFGKDDPEVIAALRELREPGFLPLRPVAVLRTFEGPLGTKINAELEQAQEAVAEGSITAVELTVPGIDALAGYEAAFAQTLGAMERDGGFVRPLLGTTDNRADGLAVTIGHDGAVLGLASTANRIGLDTPLPSGSHGKWVVLLAMAKSGLFASDARLCNRSFAEIQNAGGDRGVADCANGRGEFPIAEVFAKSLNLPLIDAARRLGEGELRMAAIAAGFRLPANGMDPALALVLGQAQASPAAVLALGNALSRFANGGEAIGQSPHLIKRIRVDGTWSVPARAKPLDLRLFLRGDAARRMVATICPAPLSGGTLSGLGKTQPDGGLACAKSATVATGRKAGHQTISKAIVVTGPSGGWYAYLGAPEGVLGGSKVSIMPLGSTVQRLSKDTQIVGAIGSSIPTPRAAPIPVR